MPSNSNLTPAQERAHLVRVIAASPTYVAWLQEHNAKILRAEATRLAERGHPALAAVLTERAEAHATGTVPAW